MRSKFFIVFLTCLITMTGFAYGQSLNPIGDINTQVDYTINLTLSATPADSVRFSVWENGIPAPPTGYTLIDNGDGTATFQWTPTGAQTGIHKIQFLARHTGTGITDDETVEFYVDQAPVLNSIDSQAVIQGQNISFDISALDADADSLVFSIEHLPNGATLTDNGDGTATFSWTPGFEKYDIFNVIVKFYVTDLVQLYTGEMVSDSETVVFTVIKDANEPPVLDFIGPRGTAAEDNLNFVITGSDPNVTPPFFTVLGLELLEGATFIDNNDGTATFDWTTVAEDEGIYSLTFFASDGEFVDSEMVVITISEPANASPVIDSIMVGNSVYIEDGVEFSFFEGSLFEFTLYASDPDGTYPQLSAENLPNGVSFIDNNDGSAIFNWTPSFTQSRYYVIVVSVTDGSKEVSNTIYLNVKDAGNQPPVFKQVGPFSVLEGEELSFMITASDPEAKPGEFVSFPSNLYSIPDGATFQDLGNDTALVTWIPTYCQAGTYTFSFVASDDLANSAMSIGVTVDNDPDNPPLPILDSIGSKSVKEGNTLIFTVTSTIPYGCEIPAIGYKSNTHPEGATWIDNGDGTGTFTWVPGYDQAGKYYLTFYADLGNSEEYFELDADSEVVVVTVMEVDNQPPIFTELDATVYTLKTGQDFSLDLEAIDPDGTPVVLSIDSLVNDSLSLPAGITFTDNEDGTGTFNFIPEDSGTYELNFKAYDGLVTAIFTVDITVLLGFGQISIDHIDGLFGSSTDTIVTCKPVTFYIKVDNNTGLMINEIRNAFRIVSYEDSLYYKDSILTDSTIDTIFYPDSLINWTRAIQALVDTNLDQTSFSKYSMTGELADTLIFANGIDTIQNDYNSVLVGITIGPINPKFAGRTIALEPVLKKVDTLEDDSNLLWKWKYGSSSQIIFPDWVGPYVFTVADTPPVENETPTISVPFTDTTINICEDIVTFNIEIGDADGLPDYGAINLPEGAVLVDSLNGIINFTWEPEGKEVGVFDITFFATDGCDTAFASVIITVNNPTPPVIVAPAFDTISFVACKESRIYLTGYEEDREGEVIFYRDESSVDPSDNEAPIFNERLCNNTSDFLPDSAYFKWIPTVDDIGEHEVVFYLKDFEDFGCYSVDSQVVTISVIENEPPVSSFELYENDYTIKACNKLSILLPWSDPEGYRMSYELAMEKETDGEFDAFVTYRYAGTIANPSNAGDTLFWTPKYYEVGDYDLKLIVEDNCGNLDSQFFSISVTENLLPVMGLIEYNDGNDSGTIVTGDTISTNEESIIFDLSGSDPDDDSVFFVVVEDLPDSAVFIDNVVENSAQYILYPVLKGFYKIDLLLTDGCGEVPISFVVKFNYDVPPGVHAVSDVLPNRFELVQNFPNPFNPYTTIEFQIPKASHVQLEVFNVLGQRIKTLIDNKLARNRYNVEWDGTNNSGNKVASGIYFYRVLTEQDVATKKMLLLK